MRLIGKELKGAVSNALYLIFLATLLLFYTTQYHTDAARTLERYSEGDPTSILAQPQPGATSYGMVQTENPALIVPGALSRLLDEYERNGYATYPVGFIRTVRLSDEKQAEVAAAIQRITGESPATVLGRYDQLLEESTTYMEGYGPILAQDLDITTVIPVTVDYATFKEELAAIDSLLGGGSYYAPGGLSQFSRESMTYEQALERYELFANGDRFTSGFARIFCDYVGIAIALFAVFVPTGFLLRDKRAKALPLVYSRATSSFRLVMARYAACLLAVFLPVLLLATVATLQAVPFLAGRGFTVAPFAFYLYSLGWLLPTAMVCVSVGFVCTIATGTPIAIAVQLVWSFFFIFLQRDLSGDFKGAFLIRHNSFVNREIVVENMALLVRNRLGFACLALVLLGASIALYSLQRRGKLDVPSIRRFRRNNKTAAHHRAA